MNINLNIHVNPTDEIVAERAHPYEWIRLGDCCIHAKPEDLIRLRKAINQLLEPQP